MTIELVAHGDRAVLIVLPGEVGAATAAEARRVAAHFRNVDGVVEATPALDTVLVEFDPVLPATEDPVAVVAAELPPAATLDPAAAATAPRTPTPIGVTLGGVAGPDADEVARRTGHRDGDLAAWVTSAPFSVLTNGFAPGFCYLGPVEHEWQLDRRDELHVVPAGSLITAVGQLALTGRRGPTGWWHVGTTDLDNVDPGSPIGVRLTGGDTLRFRAVEHDELVRRRIDAGLDD